MGSDWEKVTIESIQAKTKGAIAIGPFGSRLKSDNYVESGIPVIRGTNISASPTFEGEFVFITPEKADTLGSCNVYQNDLVFPHRGSIGEIGIVLGKDRYVLSSSLMKLTVDSDQINPMYLYYFFKSRIGQYELLKNASQVGTPGIGQPLSSLKSIEFLKPSLDEQNKIVEILKTLDNKITLNRQINQTLEQMAQTLFKSWFVDFDPVIDNALDAGNAIPDELQARAEQRQALRPATNAASQPHSTRTNPAAGDALATPYQPLPDHIRQLFPSEFEESELGWVPKGWTFKSVSEAIQVNPKVKLTKGDVAKFVDMKALPTSGYSIEDVSTKAFSGGAKFALNDVLLARITPCLQNGKTGFVDFLENDEVGFGSTEFIVLRATDSISHTYIACLARDEKFRQHAMQSMVGSSGRQRVQNSCFDDYYLAVPSCDVINKFNEMTQPSFDKFKINTNENVALEKLRDTLLPKLISGELRLDEVESTIAETTA